jgi:hypothetical protein
MSLRQTVLFAEMLSASTFHSHAQAQTNATVYGLVDATLEHSNQGLGGVKRVNAAYTRGRDAFDRGAQTAVNAGAFSKRTVLYSSIGTVGNQNGSGYSLGSGTSMSIPTHRHRPLAPCRKALR